MKESKRLQELGEELVKTRYGEEILNFLLYFRNVPKGNDFDVSYQRTRMVFQPFVKEFEISDHLKHLYSRCNSKEDTALLNLDDELLSPLNVWELSLYKPCFERRTWENFGLYGRAAEEREKPFLSELGTESHMWIESLPSVYLSSSTVDNKKIKPEVKTLREFTKDLKYLLGKSFSLFCLINVYIYIVLAC